MQYTVDNDLTPSRYNDIFRNMLKHAKAAGMFIAYNDYSINNSKWHEVKCDNDIPDHKVVNICFAIPNNKKTGSKFNNRTIIAIYRRFGIATAMLQVYPYNALTTEVSFNSINSWIVKKFDSHIAEAEWMADNLGSALKETYTVWTEYVDTQRQLHLKKMNWKTRFELEGFDIPCA